jgi:hypothetical protein
MFVNVDESQCAFNTSDVLDSDKKITSGEEEEVQSGDIQSSTQKDTAASNGLPPGLRETSTQLCRSLLAYLLGLVAEVRNSPCGYAVITTNRRLLEGDEPALHWFEYFQRLLYFTRPYLSSDPRDKIYAYLGIAQKAILPGKTMPIVPDYSPSSTPQTLYKFVATLLLTRHPRLSNLSYVEDKGSRRIHNLPSWVPDYSCPDVSQPLPILRMSKFKFECCPRPYGPAFVNITPEMSLDTRGAIFDRIVAVSKPISDSIDARDISTWFQVCVGLKGPYTPTQQDLSEVLWRTLIADTYNNSPAPDSMRKAFKYWICAHLAMSAAQNLNLGFTKERA